MVYGYVTDSTVITTQIIRKVLEDKRSYGVFPLPAGAAVGDG